MLCFAAVIGDIFCGAFELALDQFAWEAQTPSAIPMCALANGLVRQNGGHFA